MSLSAIANGVISFYLDFLDIFCECRLKWGINCMTSLESEEEVSLLGNRMEDIFLEELRGIIVGN